MIYKTKSKFWTLLLNGKIEDLISPWFLIVDLEKETITVEKRNWFYIGKNQDIIAFRFIRHISITAHLFGADIFIKAIGGSVTACYLPKKQINKIRDVLIEYDQTKTHHIIFS